MTCRYFMGISTGFANLSILSTYFKYMSIFDRFFDIFTRRVDHLDKITWSGRGDESRKWKPLENPSADLGGFCGHNGLAAEDAEMRRIVAQFTEDAELKMGINANLEGMEV